MTEELSPLVWVEAHARARQLPLLYPSLRLESPRVAKFAAAVVDRLPSGDSPVPDEVVADGMYLLDYQVRRRLRLACQKECPTALAAIETILDAGEAVDAVAAGALAAALAERQRPHPFKLRLLSTDCDLIDAPTHVLSTLIDERHVWSIDELHTKDARRTSVHAYRVRRLARLLYRHVPFRRFRRVSDKLELELEHLDRHPRTALEIARILHVCGDVDIQLRRRAEEVFGS